MNLPIHLQLDNLLEISSGNTKFVVDILHKIAENLKTFPIQIEQAFTQNDFAKMAALAHKFKSSTVYLGFEPLDKCLNRLEKYSEDNLSSQNIASLVAEVGLLSYKVSEKLQVEMKAFTSN